MYRTKYSPPKVKWVLKHKKTINKLSYIFISILSGILMVAFMFFCVILLAIGLVEYPKILLLTGLGIFLILGILSIIYNYIRYRNHGGWESFYNDFKFWDQT